MGRVVEALLERKDARELGADEQRLDGDLRVLVRYGLIDGRRELSEVRVEDGGVVGLQEGAEKGEGLDLDGSGGALAIDGASETREESRDVRLERRGNNTNKLAKLQRKSARKDSTQLRRQDSAPLGKRRRATSRTCRRCPC